MERSTTGKQFARKGSASPNKKVAQVVSQKRQDEHRARYNAVRPRIQMIAKVQVTFATSCLTILTGSLIVGSYFSIDVLNNDDDVDSTEAEEESWTMAIIRFLWFSVPAVYLEFSFALFASIRLLKAVEDNDTSYSSLTGIQFWLKVNGGLALINVAAVMLKILKHYQVLHVAGYLFILGRVYFLAQVYQFKEFFELMMLINSKKEIASTFAEMMEQLQLQKVMEEQAKEK